MEKRGKYKDWLIKNGYTENNKEDYHIKREGSKFEIYKKLDEIIIK